jgi:hypothetical protein
MAVFASIRPRTGHHSPWSFTMAAVWDTVVHGCVGGLLDGVRRLVDETPCPCRARRAGQAPAAGPPDREPDREPDRASGGPVGTSPSPAGPTSEGPVLAAASGGPPMATDEALPLPQIALEGGGEMPPGPWRWRWVWPTPGRPSGMALVAADGSLVLWSPGGFSPVGGPPDGRPTADVATALANLPEMAKAAAGADTLRWELARARAVADETKRLLNRAAGAVDDEIDRVHGPGEPDRPEPVTD